MKKKGNKVIVIVLITSLIILIVAFGFNALFLDGVGNEIKEITTDTRNTISTDDEIDDVEGWELLAKSTAGSLAGGMYIFLLILLVVIPVIISIYSAIWCLIGRLFLIGKEEKWKYNVFRVFIIAYDVFMIMFSITYASIFTVISIFITIIAITILALVAYNFYILFIKKDKVVSENAIIENKIQE